MQTLIERKDACNMQNHVAEWSNSNFDQDEGSRVLRFHIVCWSLKSRSILEPLPTKVEDVSHKHGLVEKLNLIARDVKFIWHVSLGASTLVIKKHFLKYLNWQNPQSFGEKITFMSMSTTLMNGRRKAIRKRVCTVPENWQHLRHNSSQDTGASWSSRQKTRGGMRNSNELQGHFDNVAWQMIDIFKCNTGSSVWQVTRVGDLMLKRT